MKPTPSTAKKTERVVLSLGFQYKRGSGAHRIYQHPDGRRVTISFHPGTIKLGTLRKIIGQIGISVEQFNEMV